MNTETENNTLDLLPPAPAMSPDHPPSPSADNPADVDWEEEFWPSTPPEPPLVEGDGIRQVPIGWLKPHHFSADVYGCEETDKDLVESIKAMGIQNPLKVTVDGVVISGHRRLKAAKQTDLETVPVFVARPRNASITVEEQILEANRTRVKDNEQRVREFIAYKVIETARAKSRCGCRNLVPNSAPGDAETETGVPEFAEATLTREVGKARDIAANKVGMAGSTAADGEKVVAALDRLWAKEEQDDHRQLRQTLLFKSIHAALQLGLERGWVPQATKKPGGRSARVGAKITPGPVANDDPNVVEVNVELPAGEPGEVIPRGAAPVDATAEPDCPSQIAMVPAAQEATHANIDPGEEVTVQIDARIGVEQEFGPLPLSVVDGQNDQPTNVFPVVASEPHSTGVGNQLSVPGRIFRLADGSEVVIATTGEADLITDMKLRAILQVSVSSGDKDAAGVEALTRRQQMGVSVAEMLNRLGKEFPDVPAKHLWREFCTANLLFQKQMKWN